MLEHTDNLRLQAGKQQFSDAVKKNELRLTIK